MEAPPPGKKALVSYALISVPLAFAGLPIYIYAPDYYATEFGLSLSLIGSALFLLRLVDAIQDPLIGSLSDRFSQRRSAIIYGSLFLLVVSFSGLFLPFSAHYLLLWFVLMMFLVSTAFSILSINVNAVGGLWHSSQRQTLKIASMREFFSILGLLLAILLPAALTQLLPTRQAFALVALLLGLLACVGGGAYAFWSRNYRPFQKKRTDQEASRFEAVSIVKLVRSIPRQMRTFFAVYTIAMLASSMPAILLPFFVRDRLGAEAYMGLFLLLYLVPGALAMPLWNYLSRIYDKYLVWMSAMFLGIMSFFGACFLGVGDLSAYGLICVTAGIAFGADLALPSSILADFIHATKKQENASLFFGFFAFLAKAALALASFVTFNLLEWSGFRANSVNTAEALMVLSLSYAALPCLIKSISAIMIWRILPKKLENKETKRK